MTLRNWFLYFFLAFLFPSVFAQTPTPAPTETPKPETEIPTVDDSDLIHFGDLIDVDVVGDVQFDWRGTLDPEGFLKGLDFVENPVFGLCRSEQAVAADIAKGYSKILRKPVVIVKILDRSDRAVSVISGAVRTPQRLQIKRAVFLNEVIIISGGLIDNASGEIQIFRPKNLSCVGAKNPTTGENRERFVTTGAGDNGSQFINIKIGDLLSGKKEANPQILSGDIVTVGVARAIYVIGGVATPKRISFRSEITLTRAIDTAGGLLKNADATKITIFRREGGETKIIEADLEKIKANKAEDVALQALDIIDVAQNGRDKRKYPPIINVMELNSAGDGQLPLRVID
jgi:protein involved in polysaccharide export with SLBB domain